MLESVMWSNCIILPNCFESKLIHQFFNLLSYFFNKKNKKSNVQRESYQVVIVLKEGSLILLIFIFNYRD